MHVLYNCCWSAGQMPSSLSSQNLSLGGIAALLGLVYQPDRRCSQPQRFDTGHGPRPLGEAIVVCGACVPRLGKAINRPTPAKLCVPVNAFAMLKGHGWAVAGFTGEGWLGLGLVGGWAGLHKRSLVLTWIGLDWVGLSLVGLGWVGFPGGRACE